MGHAAGRNLGVEGRLDKVRYLVRDRDSKFTRSFDEVFRTEETAVIRTPVRAPRAQVSTSYRYRIPATIAWDDGPRNLAL
jgi:hypothetical protein